MTVASNDLERSLIGSYPNIYRFLVTISKWALSVE
jgi:hypothetical protein